MKKQLVAGGAALTLLIGLVAGFEGLRNNAYLDGGGVPTICYGETRGVELGDYETTTECKKMLGERLFEFAAGVDKCLTATVPDKTYVAFVSFAYNVGEGAFCRSTLLKKANAGDLTGACDQLPLWNKDNGRVIKGLTNRRISERALCREGVAGK